jgi:hypothetical protein
MSKKVRESTQIQITFSFRQWWPFTYNLHRDSYVSRHSVPSYAYQSKGWKHTVMQATLPWWLPFNPYWLHSVSGYAVTHVHDKKWLLRRSSYLYVVEGRPPLDFQSSKVFFNFPKPVCPCMSDPFNTFFIVFVQIPNLQLTTRTSIYLSCRFQKEVAQAIKIPIFWGDECDGSGRSQERCIHSSRWKHFAYMYTS